MNVFWFAIIVLSSSIAVVVIVLSVLAKRLPAHCSRCGAQLPSIRKPANLRQVMWGGWTCPACHAELDRRGEVIVTASAGDHPMRGALSEGAPQEGVGELTEVRRQGALSEAREVTLDLDEEREAVADERVEQERARS